MSAHLSATRKTLQTVKKSNRVFKSVEVFFTLVFFGITGWVFGKAHNAWAKRKRTRIPKVSSYGSGASNWSQSQASSGGSLPASAPRLTPYTHVRLGSMGVQNKRTNGGTYKALAPRALKTEIRCTRCEKLLKWDEINRPSRIRLKSPKKNDLLTAKSESENTLKKLSRRGSCSPTKKPSRTILCFGDSNTWGYDPASQDRLEGRWPVVMMGELGAEYRVIEEGLSGRTINQPDPVLMRSKGFSHSGLEHVPAVLSSHKPLDLVIMFLGINDLQTHLNPNVGSIIQSMEQLIKKIINLAVFREASIRQSALKKKQAQILLMAPPTLRACEGRTSGNWYGAKSAKVSADLPAALEELAKLMKVHFLDTSKIVQTSELDNLHFGSEMHRKLGVKVAEKVRECFSKV